MDAKIFQFPPRPSRAIAADSSQQIFEQAVHDAYIQAADDATRFLRAKDLPGFEQASEEMQISRVAYAAALILWNAAAKLVDTARQKEAPAQDNQDS